jgi:hypothetical protein
VQQDQADNGARDQQHVQRVEDRERVGSDLGAALQEPSKERPDEGAGAVQVDADDGRPVGGLVPGEQVPGEALQHPEDQEQHADDPVQLARVLVGAEEEDPRHVEEHQDDEDAGAPLVHAADEPPERDVVRDPLDRLVCRIRMRFVVKGEDDACSRLDEERRQRRRAEGMPPARVPRNVAEEEVLDPADDPRALFEPVERDGDELDELALLLLLLRRDRHQLATSVGWMG